MQEVWNVSYVKSCFLCPHEIDEMFVDIDEKHMQMNLEEFMFLKSKSLAQ